MHRTMRWGNITGQQVIETSNISGLDIQAHYPHSHVQRQEARVAREIKSYISPFIDKENISSLVFALVDQNWLS